MTYTINNTEYPFLAKDQLEIALPILKQQHLTYDEVAGKSVQYLFGDMLNNNLELKAETLGSCYFMNDGKGNFTQRELPDELQLAPLFAFSSFNSNNKTYYIAAGNFYGVQPYEGRYDASNPVVFTYNKQTKVFAYAYTLNKINTECRAIAQLKSIKNKLLILANNNNHLIVLKQKTFKGY